MAVDVTTLESTAPAGDAARDTTARKGEAGPASMAEKRALRRKKTTEANTITFLLDTDVRRFVSAQAKEAGMDIAPFMQKLVEMHVLATAPADEPLARRIRAKRAVLERTVELAREMADQFDEHFILSVVTRAAQDETFRSNYDMAVDAASADDRALARAKAPINQQMGRLIKRAADARSKRGANGNILRAQAQGELITTYTLLEKKA